MFYNTKVVSRYKVFLKVKLTSPLVDAGIQMLNTTVMSY